MDYREYYEARNIIKEVLEKDLLGPVTEDETIPDYPVVYYVTGKIYPQGCRFEKEHSSSEDAGSTENEDDVSFDDGFVPSSMGISFALSEKAMEFYILVKAGIYIPNEEVDKKNKRILWERKQIASDPILVKVNELCKCKLYEIEIEEGLNLIILLHKIYKDGSKTVTATLVNTNKQSANESRFWVNQHSFFQPEIVVYGEEKCFTDIRKRTKFNKNTEFLELEMVYSKYRNYVTGHGCAADFLLNNGKLYLFTSYIPCYELNQMMPAENTKGILLSMNYLHTAEQDTLIKELKKWISEYKDWIDNQRSLINSLDADYLTVAKDNIDKCDATYETICKSIELLYDKNVFQAFQLANEAMLQQRIHTLEIKGMNVDVDSICWYPFQLAFILKEIISFADIHSIERDLVDLLWFPTGGGKTEAYLGIAAFVIFLRRIRNPEAGSGVSVIMRYTLRLLTFQQFERAAAMICACELLRKKYNIPGDEISIGLWAGKALTPNTLEMAEKILRGFFDPDNESSNPKQLERCPWCGATLDENNYSCSKSQKRVIIKCGNPKCDFGNGLPVYMIDEEIYVHRPSFLIATVDKFAQVARNEQTFSIFGKNSANIPPELIIQDELHLISGPLGTVTGIYEAAFQKMCTYNGVRAKVVASTATIRNADEQIKSLYGKSYTQFPPQGLNADDSYFAIKSTSEDKPSRMYMGCMGMGTSSITIMVRVMAATLFATRYLEMMNYSEKVIDSFWTITNYYNTLRELGGAIIRVVDNVQDRFAYLKETKFKDIYPIIGGQTRYDNYIELTSREKSENIGRIIQKDLLIGYKKEKTVMPYDFILASNMISVGVDIARLNTMLMNGQPKTTAEYIQATSRVGRETPGFVFTMYNQMRSRDKSYFEQFCQYHEAFYKFVEATSVTPFAERARDRALHTLYIMLCRYYINSLAENNSAGKYRSTIKGLAHIRDYILNYVNEVDPDEYENVEEELQEIEQEWEELAVQNEEMTYRKDPFQKKPALFMEDYDEDSRFRVMNSMRSVETSVQVISRE